MDPVSETPAIIEFGRFRILPHRRELLVDGQPIRIGGRAFDVLLALIAARGVVIRKDALISRVWPNRNVEENALQAQISALRDIFGADRDLIRTVRRRGFLSPAISGILWRDLANSRSPTQSRRTLLWPVRRRIWPSRFPN